MIQCSEEEFKNAQNAHRCFFSIQTKYEFKLREFLSVYDSNPTYLVPQPLPTINLTGVPSRSRIVLISKLTKKVKERTTIKYHVEDQVFTCEHIPSDQQPGNIYLLGIGSYDPDEIAKVMVSISRRIMPSSIAKITTKSRKTGKLITKETIAAEAGGRYKVSISPTSLLTLFKA